MVSIPCKNVKHERKLISEYYWQQHDMALINALTLTVSFAQCMHTRVRRECFGAFRVLEWRAKKPITIIIIITTFRIFMDIL